MLLNCDGEEDSWESLGLQGDPTSQSYRKSVLNVHWKDWCGSWNSNTLATWCKELSHWKRPWFWERLKAGGEGDSRGWDGCMASLIQWTWVWVNSRSWWWTGKPGVLQFMGLQRVEHDWATELNWILPRSQNPNGLSWWHLKDILPQGITGCVHLWLSSNLLGFIVIFLVSDTCSINELYRWKV